MLRGDGREGGWEPDRYERWEAGRAWLEAEELMRGGVGRVARGVDVGPGTGGKRAGVDLMSFSTTDYVCKSYSEFG